MDGLSIFAATANTARAGGESDCATPIASRRAVATGAVIVLSAIATLIPPKSGADPDPAAPPSDNDLIYAFPEFTPTPSNWKPKFPFPTTKPETALQRRISPPWVKCANGSTVNMPP
ncbi:hypothetical protein I552_2111 [Mycobacterium xenopi 3993]|nr:hypothetical protein I552_2111 [Mycobacterium xenopi 3993]